MARGARAHWFSTGLFCSLAALAGLRCTPGPTAHPPSVVGKWTAVAPWPVQAVHAHLLPTGKVLFYPEFHLGAELYLWDPDTDAVTRLADAPYNLFCSGHAFLPDGRLLVVGGHLGDNMGLNDASLFDPFTLALERLPDMNAGRWYPTATTLASGDMLVLSGFMEDATPNRLPQVWDLRASAWRSLTGALLTLEPYPWIFLAPDGRAFVAGPATTTRWLDTAGVGAWTEGPQTNFDRIRVYGSAVSYQPGKLLITGGGEPATDAVESIDLLSSPTWRLLSPMRQARKQHNATLLPDGSVLVIGGHSGFALDDPSLPVYLTERWDPGTEAWESLAPASTYRGYHSVALLLPDGRVLSAGGVSKPDMQIYSPPYLFRGERPQVGSAPSAVGYGETFTVDTPVPEDIRRVTWVRLGSVTHAFDQNQRFVELSFTMTSGGLRVTAPASSTLAPPGHYQMFLLNTDGVPSVARVVRLGGPPSVPPGSR
jgi:hypothetical protein